MEVGYENLRGSIKACETFDARNVFVGMIHTAFLHGRDYRETHTGIKMNQRK
tara:strand:- start:39481 stop:39636 length:156 start_codon:yes stop_codon:yes gene_type:complete